MWEIGKTELLVHTPIWDVKTTEKTYNGKTGKFVSLDAPDWVKAVVFNKSTCKWVIINEFRHGINRKVYEFPSGTVEKFEKPFDAAVREMTEETGYSNNQITYSSLLFEGNPNPAFMNNHISCYLFIVDGEPESKRNLDDFEDIDVLDVERPEDYIDQKDGSLADMIAYYLALKSVNTLIDNGELVINC